MKILPPMKHWLPARMRSRAGLGVGGALVIVAGTALAFAVIDAPQTTTSATTEKKPATAVATYQPAAKTCSGLILDRSHHEVVLKECPPAPIRAGDSIVNSRALARKPMPPRGNRLTPADRAISVPKTLRTSVWDVGISQNQPAANPPASAAVSSGETTKP
jgi:hypothetical protein